MTLFFLRPLMITCVSVIKNLKSHVVKSRRVPYFWLHELLSTQVLPVVLNVSLKFGHNVTKRSVME